MRRIVRRLAEDTGAAIAPTVALTLFALIAAGGIAFDYARVASLDTELQNAADQAALAAASQLDGQTGACARAAAAAASLVGNNTLFANESGGTRPIVVANESTCDATGNVRFYQGYNQAADTFGAASTNDDNAKVVMVAVNPREAFFALTPVVAAFRSGNIGAQAVASLGSAICKTPPVMICNPDETNDPNFTIGNYIGKGLSLVSVGNGGGAWAPGNFGYLDTPGTPNGVPGLRQALSWEPPPGDCITTNGVNTKPGANTPVTDALNTRFDVYDSNQSCPSPGNCPASINSAKDIVRAGNANGGNACKLHNQGWHLASNYYGETFPAAGQNTPLLTTENPSTMGHPRDICHAVSSAGNCSGGPVGDGNWDRDAYFRVNYRRSDNSYWTGGTAPGSWQANTGLPATTTRYEVYRWEITNRNTVIDGVNVLGPRIAAGSGAGADRAYGTPQCSAAQGYGAGQVPSSTVSDRRRIVIAVINCTANSVNGNSTNVPVAKWIEGFLVEPSLNRARTHQADVYVEVINQALVGGGSNNNVPLRRDVPYLLR